MAAIRQLVGIDKDQELIEAAKNGKCDVIEKLLKKSTSGSSLLTNLSSLLKVNINCADREKDTPLHHAALNGHVGAVEILLRENANVNVVDSRGCNPLHLAAWKGNVEICRILLTSPHSQIQVNIQNCDGETPLHSAAQYGSTPTVKILLDFNADPTIRNLKDESPLDLAARYGRVDVVQCLMDRCPDLVQSPILIHSPLHLAAACGHRQIVEILLDKGFDVNTTTDEGTALHLAALYCKTELVKILLDRGIDCSLKNRDGKTVMEILTEQKNQSSYSEVISLITEHLSRVSQQENQEPGVYDTLDEHLVRPVPAPRLSLSPEPEARGSVTSVGETVSVHYAKIEKSNTDSIPARTIQEVKQERDSMAFQNIQPFQPPFHHQAPANTPVSRPMSTRRNGNSRQTESLYDPPMQLPPKMWRGAASTQNLSLEDMPPSPCETGIQQQGNYFEMSANSPAQSPKSARPVKPQRKKKALSPVPKRSNLSDKITDTKTNSTETKDSSQPVNSQTDQVSTKPAKSDVTSSFTKTKGQDSSIASEDPSPCAKSKDHSKGEGDLDQTDYEVMAKVKHPDEHDQTVSKQQSKIHSSSKIDVTDTYQISAHVDRWNSLDRQDVIDTYKLAGEITKFREKETLPTPCQSGILEDEDQLEESSVPRNSGKNKDGELIPEEAAVEYENNNSVVSAWGGEKEKKEVEETCYENNASVAKGQFSVRCSEGFIPTRDSKGFSPVRESKEFDTTKLDKGSNETEENPYDATLFLQSKLVSKAENIPNAQCKPKGGIPKNEIKPNKDTNIEVTKTSHAGSVTNCDKNSNIPSDLKDKDVINVEPKSPSKKGELPKKPSVRKPAEKSSPSAEKIPDIPKRPKPPLVPKPALKQMVSATKRDNCDVPVCDNSGGGVYVTLRGPTPHSEKDGKSERLSNGVSESARTKEQATKPPGSLQFDGTKHKEGIPLTPTGYTQPPTPDFPPPSPHTAILGIEERMAIIDNKRSSKDMETITEDNMMTGSQGKGQGHAADTQNTRAPAGKVMDEPEEPVVLRRSSTRGSSTSLDDIVTDDKLGPFAGLYRGSVIGGPRTLVTQISDNVAHRNSWSSKRKSLPGVLAMTLDPMKEESFEKKMATIAMSTHDPRMSRLHGKEDGPDDDEEWAKIEDIMASFGGGIARESVFMREMEPTFLKKLADSLQQYPGRILSVGEWLEENGLGQYENTLVANGFDHTDFLGGKIMEESDLETIGITSSEHRKKILDSAKALPQLTPIDPDNLPPSVNEWLNSLHLGDKTETFMNKNFDTMDRVMKLWEVELISVLDITAVGHRKRILASLEHRKKPDRQFTSLKRRNKDEERSSSEPELNLYKDYTKVKPLASSSEEDNKVSQNSLPDSSEDEEVFRKEQGKALRDSSIHIRPPHQANTTTPIKQWRHRPEMLIKGCCNYTAQYLGSTLVRELVGTESTIEGITKLKLKLLEKKSADVIAKIPTILLSISYKGVKFIDAKTKKVICDHEIGNIFCACQDAQSMSFFAYITRDNQTAKHYCHVFNCRTSDLAREIIMTLGEAFEVAYQMALKDKAMVEASEFEQKLSQSDTDESSISSSKASINTV